MTDTEKGLLAAIVANPDDDLPRLAYADYLRENGREERADFIQMQLADPAKTAECMGDFTVGQPCPFWGKRSTIKMFCPNCTAFVEWSLPEYFAGEGGPVFRRGFAERVRAPMSTFWGAIGCQTCKGAGGSHDPFGGGGWEDCPTCGGEGQVNRVTQEAIALARCQPVTMMSPSDARPYYDGYGYCWYDESRDWPSEEVYQESQWATPIFAELKNAANRFQSRCKTYKSREAAMDELAKAVARLARRAAKLES